MLHTIPKEQEAHNDEKYVHHAAAIEPKSETSTDSYEQDCRRAVSVLMSLEFFLKHVLGTERPDSGQALKR